MAITLDQALANVKTVISEARMSLKEHAALQESISIIEQVCIPVNKKCKSEDENEDKDPGAN